MVGSLLFLVIGTVLQAWQHHRPFPSRWPVILAFPIACVLLLPECPAARGLVFSGAVVGTVIALAFIVHWVAVRLLREAMDYRPDPSGAAARRTGPIANPSGNGRGSIE